MDRYGRVDILVNCVGTQREEALLEVTEEAFDEVYAVNLKSAMFLGQAVARQQVARAGVADARSTCCRFARSSAFAVAATRRTWRPRAAWRRWCASTRSSWRRTRSPSTAWRQPSSRPSWCASTWTIRCSARQLEARIPLGRVAQPSDVVGPVTFFVSPAAAFVTGQVLYVDGGITASQ